MVPVAKQNSGYFAKGQQKHGLDMKEHLKNAIVINKTPPDLEKAKKAAIKLNYQLSDGTKIIKCICYGNFTFSRRYL